MSLDSNALLTVDELLSSMGLTRDDIRTSCFRVYNSSSDATTATISKVGNTLNLTVTGGTNAHNTDFDLTNASYDTIGELITAIEALSKGWIIVRLSASAFTSTDLDSFGSTDALLSTNEQTLYAFNSLLLEEIINSTSTFIENYCRRKFVSQEHTEYIDGNDRNKLRIKEFPVTVLTSVQLYDYQSETVLDTLTEHTEFELYYDEGILYKGGCWTRGRKNWKVIYTAGYTTANMPEDLKQAVNQMCSLIYTMKNKQGIKSEKIGSYSISYGAASGETVMGIGIPVSVIGMIAPYKKFDMEEDNIT